MPSLTKQTDSRFGLMQSGIGLTSGVIVSLLFQPLQVLKMSIMLSPRINGSIYQKIKAYSKIVTDQHGVRGFWNGLTPAILRSSVGNTLYFIPLRILEEKFKVNPFIASSLARILGCVAINPLTVLETRFVMPGPKQHKNLLSATRTLYKKQGFKVFWKGVSPTCIKDGLFAGIYYQLYKSTKNNYFGYQILDNFLTGLFAGGFATVISHPFQILRAKMQSGNSSIGSKLGAGFRQIYKEDGISGFLKGVTPRLARKPLINATTFMVYQTIQNFVFSRWNSSKF